MNYCFVIGGEASNPLGLAHLNRRVAPPTTIRA